MTAKKPLMVRQSLFSDYLPKKASNKAAQPPKKKELRN